MPVFSLFSQVIVSLGLPCKDQKIYNEIEIANAMIKERLFGVPGVKLCDNSNLSYRGKPAHGMLEEDGVHVSRRGVYALSLASTALAMNRNRGTFGRREVTS